MRKIRHHPRSEEHGGDRNFVGTMYGNSLLVAEEAQAILTAHGHKATVFEDPDVADWDGNKDRYALVVTSTTGQGGFTGQHRAALSLSA